MSFTKFSANNTKYFSFFEKFNFYKFSDFFSKMINYLKSLEQYILKYFSKIINFKNHNFVSIPSQIFSKKIYKNLFYKFTRYGDKQICACRREARNF